MKRSIAFILAIGMVVTGCGKTSVNLPLQGKQDSGDKKEDLVVENTDNGNADEEMLSEAGLVYVGKIYDYDNVTNETYGENFKLYANIKADSLEIRQAGYEDLQNALDKERAEIQKQMKDYKDNIESEMEFVANMVEEYDQVMEFESEVSLSRVDDKVFSFSRLIYEDLGGAHPNHVTVTRNYDTATGTELVLADVFTDVEGFRKLLVDRLEGYEYRAEFFDEWRDTVKNAFEGGDYRLEFLLTEDGVKVIFNNYDLGPYSMGSVELDFSYEELSDYIDSAYMFKKKKDFCKSLSASGAYNVQFDANNDGRNEYLSYSVMSQYYDGYENGATIEVNYGCDEATVKSVTCEAELTVDGAYLMKKGDRAYLYLQCGGSNDWESVQIIDLSNPEEGPIYVGYNEAGAFYNNIPVSTDYIMLEDRTNVCGTFQGHTAAQIGDDGQLESVDGEYVFGFYYGEASPYKVLKNIEALDITEGEESVTVKKGEKLIPYSTMDGDKITFIDEKGHYIRVQYDPESLDDWPKTINGYPEEEVFDGIIYAG